MQKLKYLDNLLDIISKFQFGVSVCICGSLPINYTDLISGAFIAIRLDLCVVMQRCIQKIDDGTDLDVGLRIMSTCYLYAAAFIETHAMRSVCGLKCVCAANESRG